MINASGFSTLNVEHEEAVAANKAEAEVWKK
jgi:hypothetical protein